MQYSSEEKRDYNSTSYYGGNEDENVNSDSHIEEKLYGYRDANGVLRLFRAKEEPDSLKEWVGRKLLALVSVAMFVCGFIIMLFSPYEGIETILRSFTRETVWKVFMAEMLIDLFVLIAWNYAQEYKVQVYKSKAKEIPKGVVEVVCPCCGDFYLPIVDTRCPHCGSDVQLDPRRK